MDNTNNDKSYTFFRFEDLRIYHKALDYIDLINQGTRSFQENNKLELCKKFNDAAYNIALNIAEGSARNKAQFIYYLKIAKTSVRECLVLTTISYNHNLITDKTENQSRGQLMELTKMLGALISSLQRTTLKEEEQIEETEEIKSYNNY